MEGVCLQKKTYFSFTAWQESPQRHSRLGASSQVQLTYPSLALDSPVIITSFQFPLEGNTAVMVYYNFLTCLMDYLGMQELNE